MKSILSSRYNYIFFFSYFFLILSSTIYTHDVPAQDRSSSGALEEIVVTARKREENLQTTPISISAFTNESLSARGITRIDEIAAYTPNLIYANIPGFNGSTSAASIYIRGVGQKEYLPTVEPGVGLYIDGVYYARSVGGVLDLIDVERIEILRGPQGTLFGRNTIGGAVSITSQKPAEEFGGRVKFTVGSDGRLEGKGSVDVPINETLRSKFSFATINRDGYVDRNDGLDLGDADTLIGRGVLNWTPNDELDVSFSFDITHADNDGAPFVLRDIDYSSALFNPGNNVLAPPTFPLLPAGAGSPSPFGGIQAGGGFTGTSPGFPGLDFYRVTPPGLDPASLAGDVPVDNFALLNNYAATFLGGQDCLSTFFAPYNPEGNPNNPACYTRGYVLEDRKENAGTFPSFSEDDIWGVNLNVEWEIGNMTLRSITAYRELDSSFSRDEDQSPLLVAQFNGLLKQEQFSQELQLLGTAFNDRMNWILGFYYLTEDAETSEFVEFTPVSIVSGGDVENESIAVFAQATYDLTEKLSITAGIRYTSDSKEFTPEQVIVQNRSGSPLFAPGTLLLPNITEKVDPSEWTPMVSAAYQWTNELMTYFTYSQGFKSGGFTQRVFPPLANIPTFAPETVTVYEGGLKWDGFDRRLRLNAAVFHTEYDDLQVQIFNGIAPVLQNAASATITGFELETIVAPAAGWLIEAGASYLDAEYDELGPGIVDILPENEFENVPDWQLNASISKEWSMAEKGFLTPRVDWSYRGDTFFDTRNSPQIKQGDYHLVNASIKYLTSNERYQLIFGVKNVFDKDVLLSATFNAGVGSVSVIPNRGREWFLSLQADF